jgi:hypothetical protein
MPCSSACATIFRLLADAVPPLAVVHSSRLVSSSPVALAR